MDELIFKQAAIDALCDNCNHVQAVCPHYPCKQYTSIESLPSAQPEPRWIPVTERPPEYGEAVLTWDGNCYCVEKRIPFIRDDDGEPIYSDWWVSDDYDEEESDYYPNLRDGACIAWMPLPKPYEKEEENA